MMEYFDIAFVLLMILFPAVFTLFVRRKESLQSPQTGAKATGLATKQRRLWIWTVVAVAGFLVLGLSGLQVPTYMTPFVFFALWFILALPVLQAKDPGWRGVPRPPVRMASLSRRDRLPASLQRAWRLLTTIWILLLFAAAAGILVDAPGAEMWWSLGFVVVGGVELALFYWVGKRSLSEAEPSSANETAEIRSARDRLRNLKLYGWFAAASVCMFVFSAPALILIWFGQSAQTVAIIVGAGGGALAGIGGGVFGTVADIRRARLNRLCIEDSADLPAL